MGLSVRQRSVGGRFWYAARWMLPLTLALAACGGSSSGDDNGGAGGEDNAGTGGTSGTGGTGGSATGGTAAAGKGGTGASAGQGGTGGAGTGGTNTSGTGGTGVPTQIGDCDEFTPCGGDPTGTWRVTETCMEVTFAMFPAACDDMIQDFEVDMVGTYTFESGVVERDMAMHSRLTLVMDDACAQAYLGSDLVTAEDVCPFLEQGASEDPATTMTCDFDGENCVCLQTQMPAAEKTSEPYQVSGNGLINGQGEPVDFCTEGDSLLLQSSTVPDDTTIVSELKLVLELARE